MALLSSLASAPAGAWRGDLLMIVAALCLALYSIWSKAAMRGTVQPVRMASLTQNARDTLEADLEIPVVSLEDVYGGKLTAAMDRQHPRDLFDVMQLFAHEGITDGIRRASSISRAVIGPCMRCCFHRCATSVTSSSTISAA